MMRKLFVILFSFVSTSFAFAQGEVSTIQKNELATTDDEVKYTTLWSVKLEGGRVEDALSNQSSIVNAGLKLDFTSQFSEEFSLNLAPFVRYQNGFYQSLDQKDSNQTTLELRNASFDIKPIQSIVISAGSLNQQKLHNSLMFYDKSFPAIRALYQSDKSSTHRFSTFVESAIPASTASTNNSYDFEKAPSLFMAGLGYEVGSLDETAFQVQANTFSYQGLSTQVANASILLGNSGTPINSTDFHFRNQFQGLDATMALRYQLNTRSSIGALMSGVYNSQAASGSNLGWKTNGFYQYQLSSKWQLIPSLTYFRIEEDATVAAYNGWMYNTNRQGYIANLDLKFKNSLKFGFQLLERNSIMDKNMSQPQEKGIFLYMETENAKI